jgi:uncharacterized coiled-coil protein SlyX
METPEKYKCRELEKLQKVAKHQQDQIKYLNQVKQLLTDQNLSIDNIQTNVKALPHDFTKCSESN